MITFLVIGVLVFAVKIVFLAIKAAWSITKGILLAVGIPVMLVALFAAGLAVLAIPLLVIALLAVFLLPIVKGV